MAQFEPVERSGLVAALTLPMQYAEILLNYLGRRALRRISLHSPRSPRLSPSRIVPAGSIVCDSVSARTTGIRHNAARRSRTP